MSAFFWRAYRDAREDPFLPANPVVAVWFVLWNWRMLKRMYAELDKERPNGKVFRV